jgi:hypothetical protein
MVASFTKDSFNFLLGNTFVHTSGWIAGLILVLLCLTLVEKEVMRGVVRTLPVQSRRAFDVAIVPLLLAFAIVVIERFRALGF